MRSLLVIAFLSCSSCLGIQDGQGVSETCAATAESSHIDFLITSADDLPPVLSGQAGTSVVFDECQDRDTFLYSVVRLSPNAAQVTLWLPETAKAFDQYFDTNHKPLPDTAIAYRFFGRVHCDDDALLFTQGEQSLNWQPIATPAGCPASTYSAVIH